MANYNLADKAPRDFWSMEKEWTIDWVLPSVDEKHKSGDMFPEAHTHGLHKFGYKEIQIRNMSIALSTLILNLVASWIAGVRCKIVDDDIIGFDVTTGSFSMKIKEKKYSGHDEEEIVFRLTWDKDPA